jgi:hypothetical protein
MRSELPGGVRLLPASGRELGDAAHGGGRDTDEDVAEVRLGVDVLQLAGSHERHQHGGAPTGLGAPGEQPVLAIMWTST